MAFGKLVVGCGLEMAGMCGVDRSTEFTASLLQCSWCIVRIWFYGFCTAELL